MSNQGRQNNFRRYNNNTNTVMTTNLSTGQRVMLKKPNRDALIARNLRSLQQAAEKKKVAQEMYYGQGRSPMVRTASGNFKADLNKKIPLRARLGNKQRQNFKQNNFRQNNQQFVPNGRQNQQFVPNGRQNQKFVPNGRQNQHFVPNGRQNKQFGLNGFRSDKIARIQNLQRKRNPNSQGLIKTVNSAGKVVMLRPRQQRLPRQNYVPREQLNYTISVENEIQETGNYKHHVKSDLNPLLQQEIRLIQNKNTMRQVITPASPVISSLPIVTTTARTMHERFSQI